MKVFIYSKLYIYFILFDKNYIVKSFDNLYILQDFFRLWKHYKIVQTFDNLYVILVTGLLPRVGAKTAHVVTGETGDRTYPCAGAFTLPSTSRLCSQLQEFQELPTSCIRMWSSSKKHQLLITLAPGPGIKPRSRGSNRMLYD